MNAPLQYTVYLYHVYGGWVPQFNKPLLEKYNETQYFFYWSDGEKEDKL